MSGALEALGAKAAPAAEQTIRGLLARQLPAIKAALPRSIGEERFNRLVLTELRRNPLLYECDPETVLGAMMLVAQLGLEPGPLGHAYLVPVREKSRQTCQFWLGYKGMIELASRSGRLAAIVARPVYEGDDFDYALGIRDKLHHRPAPPSDRGEIILYYGLARFAAPTGHYLHPMFPQEIEAAKNRSPMGRKNQGPWVTDPLPMALKTVIRRMQPFLPQSAVLARAGAMDEQAIELGADGILEAPEGGPEEVES